MLGGAIIVIVGLTPFVPYSMRRRDASSTKQGPSVTISSPPSSDKPDAAKQFGASEMQAIEKMNYQQGDWSGPAGR